MMNPDAVFADIRAKYRTLTQLPKLQGYVESQLLIGIMALFVLIINLGTAVGVVQWLGILFSLFIVWSNWKFAEREFQSTLFYSYCFIVFFSASNVLSRFNLVLGLPGEILALWSAWANFLYHRKLRIQENVERIAAERLSKKLQLQQEEFESLQAERRVGQRRSPRPDPRLIRTPREAELVVCEWMRHFGFEDAEPTPIGPDGGIDIWASDALGQVKMQAVQIGIDDVQRHFGVAQAESKLGLFFSLGGYTKAAIEWSTKVGVCLFAFDLQGEPVPANGPAERFFEETPLV